MCEFASRRACDTSSWPISREPVFVPRLPLCVRACVCEHKRENDVAVFFQPRPPIFVCARYSHPAVLFIHFYYFARFLISSREIKCAMSRIYITTDTNSGGIWGKFGGLVGLN